MTHFYKYDTCVGPRILVRRDSCGWGGVVKAHVERPWAAFVDGALLRTKGGAVRTFSSREAATDAALAASLAVVKE